MSPRLPPPERFDDAQRAELAKAPTRPDGRPLNLFATLAHAPQLLRRVNALGGYFPRHGRLDARTRELAILRTAARIGSAYEAHHHAGPGARAGLTPDELAAIADPARHHPWSPRDRSLLAFVDALIADHSVGDAGWHALDGHLDEPDRLELLILVGFYAMLGGMLSTVQVELDPLSPPGG